MQFSRILIAAVSLALAQAKIAFTTLPDSVQAGKEVTLKWSGAEEGPVTITLRKGDSQNLQTVAVLTSTGTGNSYKWTPSKDLANGDDYALQISQGVDDVNYTGEFEISGGSGKASSTSSYPISSAASSSSSVSATTTKLTTVTAANSTTSASHTITLVGSAPSASGTGVSISRNTTFSSATPTKSKHHTGGLSASNTAAATSTGGSGSSATSQAASSSTSAAAASSHKEVQIGAALAAVLGLFAML